MGEEKTPALLFEQMKSFASLARTLNLSKTVRELGSTRQTVRRHIALLEELKGEQLFHVEDRQYVLTEAGRRSLREAEELISRGEAWLRGQSGEIQGLFHLINTEGPVYYYLQEHPLNRAWNSRSEVLSFAIRKWALAQGQIEDENFASLRPYLMIFRKLQTDWICVEVGEKSSYATWYGWKWERSSVGRGVAELPGGTGFANLLSQPFHDTATHMGLRLDHIHTMLPRDTDNPVPVPITYERLLLGCYFADGSPAIGALINRTYDIEIQGMPEALPESMPEELIMEFEDPEA